MSKRLLKNRKTLDNQCCICKLIKLEIQIFKRNEKCTRGRNYCIQCIELHNNLLKSRQA